MLVGDFLYSRAFEMMVEVGNLQVMEIMSHATNTIAEGEVLQLLNCHDADTTEERYLEVIRSKTAKLFEAAAEIGAVICDQHADRRQAMRHYGIHLGTAFQLVDDVLDYSASPEQTGKNIGDDLAEGKPTLPLIYAMRNGSAEQSTFIRHAIENGGRDNIDQVIQAIESTGAIAYTAGAAQREVRTSDSGSRSYPDSSPYKDAMHALAAFAVQRNQLN